MCPLGTPVPRQLLGQVPSSSDTLPEIGVEFKERPSPRRIVMNFTPYLVAWAVIAAVTITLLIYRAVVGAHEDESLHVAGGGARLVAEQQAMFKKLGVIERWTKIFLILTVVYGLALGGAYLYYLLRQGM